MTTKKTTFVDRVKAALKLDDDAKIKKFQKETLRELRKQIQIREVELEELETSIAEKQEELEEKSTLVDLERIKVLSERKNYIEEYTYCLIEVLQEIDNLEDKCKGLSEEVVKLEQVIEKIK